RETALRDAQKNTLAGRKIGFLGGGAMAGALIKGLLESGSVDASQVRASDSKATRLTELCSMHGIEATPDNAALVRWADVVVVAVKPQIVDRVLPTVAENLTSGALVVSIAAGVPLEVFEGA